MLYEYFSSSTGRILLCMTSIVPKLVSICYLFNYDPQRFNGSKGVVKANLNFVLVLHGYESALSFAVCIFH